MSHKNGQPGAVRAFAERHFTHFNARELLAAARAYEAHIEAGGKMMVTLAGAMSTAGIGRTLARLIRADMVHAISCTGANLEEDVFRLLAGDGYEALTHWRQLSSADEQALRDRGMNRVTDTAIPESVMSDVRRRMEPIWQAALDSDRRYFPHEMFWHLLEPLEQVGQSPALDPDQASRDDCWVLAAKQKQVPIVTPGWEDSTLGNMFTAWALRNGVLDHHRVLRSGTEAMTALAHWYRAAADLDQPGPSVGLFQIGGGIAGDFPICVVPMMIQDLGWARTPYWGYFAQITDAVTSYGGYSGATPNEKITWSKLAVQTPKFVIESDASIVAPLIFAYLLGD